MQDITKYPSSAIRIGSHSSILQQTTQEHSQQKQNHPTPHHIRTIHNWPQIANHDKLPSQNLPSTHCGLCTTIGTWMPRTSPFLPSFLPSFLPCMIERETFALTISSGILQIEGLWKLAYENPGVASHPSCPDPHEMIPPHRGKTRWLPPGSASSNSNSIRRRTAS